MKHGESGQLSLSLWTAQRRMQTPRDRVCLYFLGMFGSTSAAIDFLPEDSARAWVADRLTVVGSHLATSLGEAAVTPRVITDTSIAQPRDLDDLFELVCGVQAEVGQEDVEFSLVEMEAKGPSVPPGFAPLGNPEGHLLHTFAKEDEFVVLVVPSLFRVPAIALSSVARELGRIAIHLADRAALATGRGILRRGTPETAKEIADREADAELAAVTLGMGVWIANGAYIYENACCGGGCGVDLRSIRAALSMPEACFALAVDGQRKGLSRRVIAKHLDPNQKAALKRSWGFVKKQPELAAAPTMAALGA